jgi:hypothetical protein
VNAWDTTYLFVPLPKVALILRCFTPFFVGVPEMVAVPLPSFTNVTCFGNLPFSVMDGIGVPYVVTVNEKYDSAAMIVWFGLVMPGVGGPILNDCCTWGAGL